MSNIGYAYKSGIEKSNPRRRRRSFRQWLKNYIIPDDEGNVITSVVAAGDQHRGFNKSFDGWNIRLHKANGGHIVEAWKSDDGPRQTGYGHKPDHELFMVKDEDDMSTALNDILVQLMLRG